MENKDQNNVLGFQEANSLEVQPVSVVHTSSQTGATLESPDTQVLGPSDGQAQQRARRIRPGLLRPYTILIVVLLLTAGIIAFVVSQRAQEQRANDTSVNSLSPGQFDSIKIPLQDLLAGKDLSLAGGAIVTINGTLQANGGLLLAPSLQPTGAKPGQIYYDQGTNQLAYFNGTNFVFLTAPPPASGIQSLGGATGQLTLGPGLTLTDNELSNGGVLSVQGEEGEVTFTAGAGIVINGTNFSNSGVISIASANPNLTVETDDEGNVTLDMVGGAGSVTSGGGTAGAIPVFTADQNVEDSIISQAGLAVSIAGDLQVTGGLTLGTVLPVSQGGTGAASQTANGVLVGNGTAAISSIAAGGVGLCLLSTAGAPAWGACPGSSGVTSLDGLTGALTIANTSGAGSTITINDASTSAKGIASFSGTNFSVASGAVNTIQDINTSATPTFAGINTNSITPSAALTIGATGQTLLLQGNASTTLVASSGANATTVSFQSPTANVTYRFLTATAGTYDICTTAANCAGLGGAVSTSGGTTNRLSKFSGAQSIADSSITDDGTNVLTSIDLVIQGGDLTVGVPTTQTGTINLAHSGSGFLGNIVQGSLTANRTYTLPDASGTICLTSGNCAAVTSLNGLIGALSIANASAAGTTITINDASTSAKGIASFNSTNFSASAGAINTIQDIHSGATPTFAGVNTNTITSGGTLAIQGTTNITGNIDVSGTLTAGTANAFQVAAGGTITTAGNVMAQGGSVTSGAASQAGSYVIHAGNGNAGTLQVTALGQNTTYTLPDPGGASATICLTSGNCAGTGGGVTTAGGTTNRLAKFASAQGIADSTITDNGTAVTTTVDLVIQGGDITVGTSSQLASLILHDGNGQTTTLQAGDSSGGLTFILPTNAGSASQCLKQSGTGNQLIWDACDGGGGGSSATLQAAYNNGNSITTTDARDIDIVLANTTTDSLFDVVVADNSTGFVSFTRANGAGAADPAQLLLIDNLDTDRAVGAGIKLQAAGGGMTTAIDATDAEIVDAINVGVNNIVGTTGNIDFTNFDVAGATGNVTMAGNLAVNSGTITSSGNINSTGGGLQTNSVTRVDSSGNLTSIGNITGTGAITIASSGAGNDVIINGADIFDVQDATTFASTAGFNGVATFSSDLAANGNVTIGDGLADLLTITSILQGGSPLTFEGASADANELTLSIATLTGDHTITLPDETGTVCLQSSSNCGFALSSGSTSYIQNQSAADQTADFRISGTGRAAALQALSLDTATAAATLTIGGTNAGTVNIANNAAAHTINIATSSGAAQTVVIGSANATSTTTVQGGTGASAVSIQGGASGTISIGTAASNTITVGNTSTTATLTLGQSTASNTINIGNATTATGNTQTINIGTNATGTGRALVTIGNTNAASAVNIQAGTGNINLTTNASTASVIAKSSTNSTTAFQIQNSSNASLFTVDTSGSNIAVLANNSSALATWTTTTAMTIGTNTARVRGGAVAANGYLYHIGGVDGSANTLTTVQYARLNADGTVGTWASTTALPDARKQFQPVVLNGYIYVIGGRNNSNTVQSTTYYAKLSADGTVGAWNTATALPAARFSHGTVAYNGYIYVFGGLNSGFTSQTTVYSIKANPDGTLASAWTTPTALPVGLASSNGIIANGYVYLVGGFTSGYEDDIYYSKLNIDGTLGSWSTVTNALNASGGGDENFQSFVANGYLYAVGGDLGNRVVAFALGSDGSLGTGVTLTALPINPMGEAAGASDNGYFYLLGGSSGSDGGGTARNTVYYTSGSRVKVGGNLDLVGYTGENLAEGRSGGQLTAGNTIIVGTLQVQDSVNFTREANIGGTLRVADSLSVGGNINIPSSSSTAGIISQNGTRWIHSAGDPSNFFAGPASGNLTTTGTDNVGIGEAALQGITSGFSNVGIGTSALMATTDGIYNVGTGYLALQANIGGTYNSGFGARALYENTTGDYNTAIGGDALYSNIGGANNVALGYQALTFNETGNQNVAVGVGAGFTSNVNNANVSGSQNTFIGYNSGFGSTTQYTNVTTLGAHSVVGRNNAVILGCINGVNGCPSAVRVGIGIADPSEALQIDGGAATTMMRITNSTTGPTGNDGFNMGIDTNGTAFLQQREAGNIAFYTSNAFKMVLDGDGDLGIGQTTPASLLHVGSSSLVAGTTVARFQNASATCTITPSVGGGISCTSDHRLKKNIKPFTGALAMIEKIDVKTYNMMADKDTDQKQIGVLAQELEKVLPGLVTTDEKGQKAVSYAGLSPVLLQAIKEQQKQIDELKQEVGDKQIETAGATASGSWFGPTGLVVIGLAGLIATGALAYSFRLRQRPHPKLAYKYE